MPIHTKNLPKTAEFIVNAFISNVHNFLSTRTYFLEWTFSSFRYILIKSNTK